jgi:hypothetical protein
MQMYVRAHRPLLLALGGLVAAAAGGNATAEWRCSVRARAQQVELAADVTKRRTRDVFPASQSDACDSCIKSP